MIKIKTILLYSGLLLLAILPLILSFKILHLKDPPVWPDEAVFYDMAKNLITNNSISTRIYIGTTSDVQNTGLGYPPVFFYIFGYFTDIFGSDIEIIRSLFLGFGIFSLVAFFYLSKIIFKNNFLSLLGTIMLSLDIFLARSSRTGRMEITTFFFMMLSYLFYILTKTKKRNIYFLLAGITSGLALLNHPIGAIAPIIIAFNILITDSKIKVKVSQLLIFIIPVILAIPFWIIKSGNFLNLISTYGSHLQDKSPKLPFAFVLFQSSFSWWLLFVIYLIIFAFFLVTIFKLRTSKEKYVSFFLLSGIVISTIILLWGREGYYILYFQPFITLIVLFLLKNLYKKLGFILILCLTILIIICNLNIQFFNNNSLAMTNSKITSVFKSQKYDYHIFTKSISEILPKQKSGIFLSSTPDPYFDLIKFNLYHFYEAPDPSFPISESAYRKVLDDSDYAIITWIPHKLLAEYIENNKEKIIPVGQTDGYQAIIIKFVPKDKRI